MAVIHNNPDYYLIDHRDFITNIYRNAKIDENESFSFSMLKKLFSIINVEKNQSNRKRSHNSDDFHKETLTVKEKYESFIQKVPLGIKEALIKKYKLLETSEVRDLSKQLFEATVFDFNNIKGGNNAETSLKCSIKDNNFLIPPNSRYCSSKSSSVVV